MAYVPCQINDGSYGTFQAAADITLYQRCKFTNAASALDGKAKITPCAIGERGDVIAMQPIASGEFGTVRFLNAGGEQYGQASGSIGVGVAVYTAATGLYSAASGGGALLVGTSTTEGFDGGPFTWIPNTPAA